MYSGPDTLERVGFPIRISADQRSLASPRSFSQRATSFIASWRQGIHRTPLSHSPSNPSRPHAGPNRAPRAKQPKPNNKHTLIHTQPTLLLTNPRYTFHRTTRVARSPKARHRGVVLEARAPGLSRGNTPKGAPADPQDRAGHRRGGGDSCSAPRHGNMEANGF